MHDLNLISPRQVHAVSQALFPAPFPSLIPKSHSLVSFPSLIPKPPSQVSFPSLIP